MKKLFTIAAIVTAMTTITASADLYAACMTITDTNAAEDIMVAVDGFGEEWVLEMNDDWRVGDKIAVLADDMGTEYLYDDEVIDFWYAGPNA